MMGVRYTMSENPSFFKRPWVWMVLVTLVSVGGMLAAYLSKQVGDRDWWRREATAYNTRHAVQDEANAAPFYMALAATPRPVNTSWRKEDWRLPLATTDLALLEGQETLLAGLREAAAKPGCFYPLDPFIGNPAAMPLPWLAQLKLATNLLLLQARREAGEGRPEEAARSLRDAMRLGFQHERGVLITQLVSIGCRGLAYEGLERLAMDAPPSPETLEALAAELQERASQRPSLAEFWESERLFGRGCVEFLYQPDSGGQFYNMGGGMGSPTPLARLAWPLISLRWPLQRTRVEFDEVYDLFAKENRTPAEAARIQAISNGGNLFVGLLPPALGKAEGSRLKNIALERQTRVLLLLKAHQLRTGAYPGSLDALRASTAVELPEDPYTGKPFLYQADGDGFHLSSVVRTSGTPPRTPGSAGDPAGSAR